MVEVVGTAPTSAMVITKFVYRHSWKSNDINIIIKIVDLKIFKKKNLLSITLIVTFVILSLFGIKFYDEVLLFLLKINIDNTYYFLLYLTICFFYFLSPLPVTFIILLNGYLFKDFGFFVSIILIIVCSSIIFLSAELFAKKFNLDLNKILKIKKIDIKKLTQKKMSIFISRYIVPYFFHNIYYGLIKLNFKSFIIIILLAELPMIFSINSVGKSLNTFSLNQEYSIIDLLYDKNFNIPLLVIISILFFQKYINTK